MLVCIILHLLLFWEFLVLLIISVYCQEKLHSNGVHQHTTRYPITFLGNLFPRNMDLHNLLYVILRNYDVNVFHFDQHKRYYGVWYTLTNFLFVYVRLMLQILIFKFSIFHSLFILPWLSLFIPFYLLYMVKGMLYMMMYNVVSIHVYHIKIR